MSKRNVIGVCALLLVFGLSIWFLTGFREEEPSLKGKKLSKWISEYRLSANPASREEAERAVLAIGTNALPTFLHWIQQEDSSLRAKVFRLVRRLPGNKTDLRQAIHKRGLAGFGFHILGSEARPAIPELTRLLENDASAIDFPAKLMVAESAVAALREIGSPAIPALVQAVTNRHESVRKAAAQTLGEFGTTAAQAVPALVGCLSDTNAEMRLLAVRSLGQIGQDENVVVPALANILADRWELNRIAAVTALRAFGPRAESAAPHLLQILTNQSESDQVRDVAKKALAAISGSADVRNDANEIAPPNSR